MKALPKRKGNAQVSDKLESCTEASMKALPKRKGNAVPPVHPLARLFRLNESPYQKEGKCRRRHMTLRCSRSLNESPSQKEGKLEINKKEKSAILGLNESPSQKEGKWLARTTMRQVITASMKALPKRKGNTFVSY